MSQMWLGLLLLLPTMERRAASSAMATDHALASGAPGAARGYRPGGQVCCMAALSGRWCAGMGGGEYQAAFANFRATGGGIPLHGHAFLRLSKLASAATASTGGGSRHTRSYTTHAAVERVALACPAGARIASVSHADAAAACNGRQSCSFVARAKLALTFDCENY